MALRLLDLSRPTRWTGLHISWPSLAEHRVLFIFLAITLVRGVLYAVLNPPFGSPDERAHFMYVQHLATGGATPKGEEGHQPVPYYAMMVPAYWLTAGQPEDTQLLAIRLLSLPFLLGVVLFTWLAARKMTPDKPMVWMLSTSLVAFHPQLAYIGASANNDNAANFMGAVLVFVVVTAFSERRAWFIPLAVSAVAAALMTKGQVVPMVAITIFVVATKTLVSASSHARVLLIVSVVPFILVAATFLSTNEGTILVDRYRFVLAALERWEEVLGTAQQSGLETFYYQISSFWAAFQGESLRPPSEFYLGPMIIAFVGLVGYAATIGRYRGQALAHGTSSTLLPVSLAAIILVQWLLPYVWHLTQRVLIPDFPWTLQLLQGRYRLLIMPAVALLVAEGWQLLVRGQQNTAGLAAVFVVIAWFTALDASSLLALVSLWQAALAS